MDNVKDLILQKLTEKKLTAEEAAALLQSVSPQNAIRGDSYAVIGMALRFPDASTPLEFWDNLLQGKDSIRAFPKQRRTDVVYVNQQTHDLFNGYQCRIGGYLEEINLFDHSFFQLTPAEARSMDPGQRIFLEVAIEALEGAGLTKEILKESRTGVFVGYSVNDDNYIDILSKDDPNLALGNQPSLIAYRLSFLYDMRGPTMTIDSACSSSLVAVHQACQSMSSGDCDMAIVGGINIRIFPAIREIANLGIEAFDGRCKTFDAKANGTNIAEGVAALVLKPYRLAEKDGDPILAIIRGSAVNSDGTSNGLTAPNPEAQAQVIATAWQKAGINPENIAFLETHGTGTKLGDPIEILGLTHAFKQFTEKKKFCPLGAVKTNIGHTETTSGMAGLIKAILCLQNRKLPPNLHFKTSNPYIDFENSAVFPNIELIDWKNNLSPLLAGVSSFGLSGTNCHIVLEEAPSKAPTSSSGEKYCCFSAQGADCLKNLLQKFANFLAAKPSISLNDLSYTLARGRNHYEKRLVIAADSISDLEEKINRFIQEIPSAGVYTASKENIPEIAAIYLSGQPLRLQRHFPKGSGQKIALPTYAFQGRRHWPKLEIEQKDSLDSRLSSIFYRLNWKEEKGPSNLSFPVNQKFFLFLQKDSQHEAWASFLINQGLSVLKIYPGQSFEHLNDLEMTIRPEESEDYLRLVQDEITENFGGVLHFWEALPNATSMNSWEALQRSQNLGSLSLFHLIRALRTRLLNKEWQLVAAASYAHAILPQETWVDPSKMPAAGIVKVASQEMPLLKSLFIDLDLEENLFIPLSKDIFTQEPYKDAVVGYRNGKRYVQILERQNTDSLANRTFSIRSEGVYLIAGGAGYLGLSTARLLARKNKVKIALFGRKEERALSEKQRKKIEEIRSLGSEIAYFSGDVTNKNSCQIVIDAVVKKWGPIHGIFASMKNISHQRLSDVSFENFKNNILAKVQGTWLLDHLTQTMPIDFLATFSSISSLTGGPTGADCCASNLFLDCFGDWRNGQGRETITMNYTLIEADDGSLLSDRMSMIPPLTKEEFLGCLELCLTKKIDFAVMADFNSHVMNLVLPFMKVRFGQELLHQFGQTITASSAQAAPLNLTLQEGIEIMKRIWQNVLGTEEIDARSQFFELGGDSISAVKLLHLIKVQLQAQVEIADLYSYPILEDLCRWILNQPKKTDGISSLEDLLAQIDSGKLNPQEAANAYKQVY